MARGLSADEARREAASRFGNLEFTREYCRAEDDRRERETRHTTMIDELKQDLIYALRALRSAPGFALVALLTLALGIGANTAIFSVVRGVLLSPLPFPEPDRVVRIWHTNRSENDLKSQVSEPDFKEWAAATKRLILALRILVFTGRQRCRPHRRRHARTNPGRVLHADVLRNPAPARTDRANDSSGGGHRGQRPLRGAERRILEASLRGRSHHRGPRSHDRRHPLHGRRRHGARLHVTRPIASTSGCRCPTWARTRSGGSAGAASSM